MTVPQIAYSGAEDATDASDGGSPAATARRKGHVAQDIVGMDEQEDDEDEEEEIPIIPRKRTLEMTIERPPVEKTLVPKHKVDTEYIPRKSDVKGRVGNVNKTFLVSLSNQSGVNLLPIGFDENHNLTHVCSAFQCSKIFNNGIF